MTLLDEDHSTSVDAPDEGVIDLAEEDRTTAEHRDREVRWAGPHRIEPTGRIPYRGMRIRRMRLLSVAKISAIFWILAFGVLLGTVLVVWNVAHAFGMIESFEQTLITSLGLETFEIDGSAAFGLVAGGLGLLCALGWLGTIAMAAIYNAACGVLGGLAVETGPLQRRRRVFSWRHRGLVTVSE